MSKVDSVQAAPDSSQISDLLLARLKGTAHVISLKRYSNSAVPMLMDRLSPDMRQGLFSFIEEREHNDVVLANELIGAHVTRPNVIAAVLATLDMIRKINSGLEDYRGNEIADIRECCRSLGIELREDELREDDFSAIIATYLVAVTFYRESWRRWELSADIAGRLMKHPDFLDNVHLMAPPLTALASTCLPPKRLSPDAVFEIAAIIHQKPLDALRLTEWIKGHKGYDKALVVEMLASQPTPLEGGAL